MKRVRPTLSYANVVATLALFLALTGGIAWAAHKITSKQIGKGAVKSRNLAKNAVKGKNLAGSAVTSAKLANGAVTNAKLAEGAVNFAKIAAGTNVIASATSAPVAVTKEGPVPVPLNPPLVLTPVAGQPITLNLEARGTLTQANNEDGCAVEPLPFVNGVPMSVGFLLQLVAPEIPPQPAFPLGTPFGDASFPVGLTQPGKPLTVTLDVFGDADCAPGSTLDQVAIVATQVK